MGSSWWVRQRFLANDEMPATAALADGGGAVPSEQSELLARCAHGIPLDTINRQASMLIVLNGLELRADGAASSCVHVGVPVAAGEVVMLLPPNLLLWESQADDPKGGGALQVGMTRAGERLFSSSITPGDIGNHLRHTDEPNCRVEVGSDLVAALIATRAIAAGEAVTFDHERHAKSFCGVAS